MKQNPKIICYSAKTQSSKSPGGKITYFSRSAYFTLKIHQKLGEHSGKPEHALICRAASRTQYQQLAAEMCLDGNSGVRPANYFAPAYDCLN